MIIHGNEMMEIFSPLVCSCQFNFKKKRKTTTQTLLINDQVAIEVSVILYTMRHDPNSPLPFPFTLL